MGKGKKKNRGKNGVPNKGMEVDGADGAGWTTEPVISSMDTSEANPTKKTSAPANNQPKDKALRGQKFKIQKQRKKVKLEKALERAEKQETRVAKQSSKAKKKVVLKSLYR